MFDVVQGEVKNLQGDGDLNLFFGAFETELGCVVTSCGIIGNGVIDPEYGRKLWIELNLASFLNGFEGIDGAIDVSTDSESYDCGFGFLVKLMKRYCVI